MANPIALPSEVILGINTIKAIGIDPNDFNNAVQELYNRGYGKIGTWIQEHKDLYLKALQNGYVAEDNKVPNSEPPKDVAQSTPAPLPGDYIPPVDITEDDPGFPSESDQKEVDDPEPVEKSSGKRKSRL